MVVDASDAQVTPAKPVAVLPASIPNNDPIASDISTRVNQQRILPVSVQGRLLGQILTSHPAGTDLGTGVKTQTITIYNSTSAIFSLTVQNNLGRVIDANPDISLYINDPTGASPWPNANYAMGNFPLTTYNSWAYTDNINTVTQLVARNNSGADVEAFVIVRWRIITDPTTSYTNRDNTQG